MLQDTKTFKTIDEQISILKKRGLIIPEEDRAREYLLSNNYYNIINGYSKPFLQSNDKYIKGASFNEVSQLYFFDKELKQLIFDAILDAEHHLKSIFAYRFSQLYPNQKYSYLDINVYDHHESIVVARLISKLNFIINKNKKYNNNSIYHYCKKYHNVPIWVLVDYLDFGTLCDLISCSKFNLRKKIAYDLIPFIKKNNPNFDDEFLSKTMISLIENMHETRNICAHNNRLIYFRCRSDCQYYEPLHSKYNIRQQDSRNRLYSTLISLQCFISDIEYAKTNNSIRKRANFLKNHLHSIDINDIFDLLGFPHNWNELKPIIQKKHMPSTDNRS